MQVRKFEAQTMAEALKLVKTELGPEAIILSTKNHRKGFGLLSKASVEVTAAVADKSLAKKQVTEKVVPPTTKEAIGKLSARKQAEIFDEFSDHYQKRRENKQAAKQASNHTTTARNASAPQQQQQGAPTSRYIDIADDDELAAATAPVQGYARNGRMGANARAPFSGGYDADAESARVSRGGERNPQATAQNDATRLDSSLKTAMQTAAANLSTAQLEEMASMQQEIQALKSMLEEIKTEQTAITDAKIADASSDELQVEYQNLLRNGIDKRFATSLVKQVSFTVPRDSLKSSDAIVEAIAIEMMNGLKVEHPLEFRAGTGQRVFAMIGPTGVGKTTTIAKLASQAILQKNLRVGLINVDSYKVAALDQLATYAKILNVPFRQASNAAELDRALAEFKPLDLVLIDTSGRSQRDSESLTQMKTLLSECASVRPILIMSATTRDQELYDIITRFKIFNPTGLIFSKLDESATFGCIYNVTAKTGLPLTYFTVGQRVPEDIEPASRERVVDLVLDI